MLDHHPDVRAFRDLADQYDAKAAETIRRETSPTPTRTVRIPGSTEHAGWHLRTVTLLWVCPRCGGPRGEPFPGVSYDGSRRLSVDQWINPCGHVDWYSRVRAEADGQELA